MQMIVNLRVTIDHANILHDVKTLNVGSAEVKIDEDSSFMPAELIFFSQKTLFFFALK